MSQAVRNNPSHSANGTATAKTCAKSHCQLMATIGASRQSMFSQITGRRATGCDFGSMILFIASWLIGRALLSDHSLATYYMLLFGTDPLLPIRVMSVIALLAVIGPFM